MDRLSDLRSQIEKIDEEILSLIKKRLEIAKEIVDAKNQKNMKVYDPDRENKVINKIKKISEKLSLPEDYILDIYTVIISMTRNSQGILSVAFLGPEGTFSDIAVEKKFGYDISKIPVRSIPDIFREVSNGKADIGVVPIENSYNGIVPQTLDEFVDSHLKIVGELYLRVHHSLLSTEKSLDKIKRLYSHPQAIAQCKMWIENNLKEVEIIETLSTALASQMAKNDKSSACIGNEILSKKYGLNILETNIEDDPHNLTRFWIIGDHQTSSTGNDKTTILCYIKDKPGALFDMIKPFKDLNVNMTKIESRPSKIKPWDYMFFIDFEGHVNDENIKLLLSEVEKHTSFLKVIGSYSKGVILE